MALCRSNWYEITVSVYWQPHTVTVRQTLIAKMSASAMYLSEAEIFQQYFGELIIKKGVRNYKNITATYTCTYSVTYVDFTSCTSGLGSIPGRLHHAGRLRGGWRRAHGSPARQNQEFSNTSLV